MGENVKYHIVCRGSDNEIRYLAWQKPAWDESGYFWTDLLSFRQCAPNSTEEHPFLFDNRIDALKFIKSLELPYECSVMTWNLYNRQIAKTCNNLYYFPGIAIEVTK